MVRGTQTLIHHGHRFVLVNQAAEDIDTTNEWHVG